MKYFLGKFRWEFYSLIKEKLQGKRNGRRLHYLTNFCLLQCNWSSWHFLKFRLKPKEALHILWEVKAIPLINSFNTSLLAYLFNPRILFLYWIRTHQNVFSIYVFCSICTEASTFIITETVVFGRVVDFPAYFNVDIIPQETLKGALSRGCCCFRSFLG